MKRQLQELYRLSEELIQLKWWELCEGENPILIKNPLNDVTGYCVFLGNNGDYPEIIIYLGDEGITSYLDLDNIISSGYLSRSSEFIKSLYRQKALSFVYENNETKFCCLNPGEFPQPLEDIDDIQFFTIMLEQLICILNQINSGELEFRPYEWINAYQEKSIWKYDYIEEEEILNQEWQSPYYFNYRNDLKIHRLKKLEKVSTTLEGVQFFVPPQVWDHELKREIIPILTTFVDQEIGAICLSDLTGYKLSNLERISDKLADIFLKQEYVPDKIVVEDDVLKDMIRDFCEQLNIECHRGSAKTAKRIRDLLLGF